MKKKSLILITVSLAITLTVAAVGVAFAWYTESAGAGNQIELNADGYLVVYFEENECTLDAIKPAVARKGAITEGIADFNVLEVGENVVEAATVVKNEDAMFRYLNESNQQSNRADIEFSCEAYMVFPDGTKQKISLKYDISVKIDMTWVYLDQGEGEGGSGSVDGTYTITEDDWQTPSKTKFTLENSADVTMTTTLYFRQVDDLCDPLIMGAEKIQVIIKAVAVPEADEAAA
ncbi:MAG: hypothetical protein K2M36_00845 [Clostridia bacterium]|nr:hypothetical protein [Clostridia bacterium]